MNTSSLENQLREMYGRAAYTQKTHEKMADIYVCRYRLLKTIEIALSAIATGSLIVAIFGESSSGTITGALFSSILLFFTLYFKEASLGEQAQRHTEVASKLWGIREVLLSLLVDMRDQCDLSKIRTERDKLNERLEEIYRNCPRTTPSAYAAAQRALKSEEELFFTDSELNRMLPKTLRTPVENK
jgi:hypothetical protein